MRATCCFAYASSLLMNSHVWFCSIINYCWWLQYTNNFFFFLDDKINNNNNKEKNDALFLFFFIITYTVCYTTILKQNNCS